MDEPPTFRVYLQGEIPRFPAGWHLITVSKIGHRWASLQCGRKKRRVPRDVWVKLLASSESFTNRMAVPAKPYLRR